MFIKVHAFIFKVLFFIGSALIINIKKGFI